MDYEGLGDFTIPAVDWLDKPVVPDPSPNYKVKYHRRLLGGGSTLWHPVLRMGWAKDKADAFRRQWRRRNTSYFTKPKEFMGTADKGPWAETVLWVFRRDTFKCVYCGACGCDLECDHIIPLARGGTDHRENLATACVWCNRAKLDTLICEWRGRP